MAAFGWEKALGDPAELSWWEATAAAAAARQHIPVPEAGLMGPAPCGDEFGLGVASIRWCATA